MIQLPVPVRRELRYTKFHNAESFSSAAFVSLSSFSPIPLIVLHRTNATLCPYSTCYQLKAVDIGVDGYILKDSESAELKKAIFSIVEGENYIQPSLIPSLNSKMIEKNRDEGKIESLTKRELEVLKLLAVGMYNKEVAEKLNISERTVKNHVSNIFKKIEVTDRTQAAVFAIRNNLIEL